MKYLNKPTDLSINYKVETYNKLEIELFDLKENEQPLFHFMLALFGYKSGKKVELNTNDGTSKTREFSIRTVYPRNESDLDAYYGLLTILDNLTLDYDYIIDKVAFERTGVNGTSFLKMKNVRTFYEYMLSGIDYFEENILINGSKASRVASEIYDFLMTSESDLDAILIDMMLEEEKIDDND